MNKNIIAVILIIVGIGLYFTISSPVFDEAKGLKAQDDKLLAAIDSADKIIKMRDEITRKYNSIPEKDRVNLDKMIPGAVDNIRLVIDLNNLAMKNHFTLSNLRASVPSSSGQTGQSKTAGTPQAPSVAMGTGLPMTQSTVSEPVLDKIQVSFSATAPFDYFMDFMRDLEADLRVSDITKLSMTASDNGVYTYSVQFQTYWLRQ